jgi:hypothetical protein
MISALVLSEGQLHVPDTSLTPVSFPLKQSTEKLKVPRLWLSANKLKHECFESKECKFINTLPKKSMLFPL